LPEAPFILTKKTKHHSLEMICFEANSAAIFLKVVPFSKANTWRFPPDPYGANGKDAK